MTPPALLAAFGAVDGVVGVGMCQCGCGRATGLARRTESSRGWVRGEPLRFVLGHSRRGRYSDPASRFWPLVHPEPNSGCYLWSGSATPDGYGHFWANGKLVYAHRFAWTLSGRPLADDELLLHACDNPPCVNVDHLIAGSLADNAADMTRKGRGRTGKLPFGVRRVGRRYYVQVSFAGGCRCAGGGFLTVEEAANAARSLKESLYS